MPQDTRKLYTLRRVVPRRSGLDRSIGRRWGTPLKVKLLVGGGGIGRGIPRFAGRWTAADIPAATDSPSLRAHSYSAPVGNFAIIRCLDDCGSSNSGLDSVIIGPSGLRDPSARFSSLFVSLVVPSALPLSISVTALTTSVYGGHSAVLFFSWFFSFLNLSSVRVPSSLKVFYRAKKLDIFYL